MLPRVPNTSNYSRGFRKLAGILHQLPVDEDDLKSWPKWAFICAVRSLSASPLSNVPSFGKVFFLFFSGQGRSWQLGRSERLVKCESGGGQTLAGDEGRLLDLRVASRIPTGGVGTDWDLAWLFPSSCFVQPAFLFLMGIFSFSLSLSLFKKEDRGRDLFAVSVVVLP